ncbi:hypothetical protein [Desulfosarcina ovata]|nr:hypothetical protein [Desulfosarcina ovata]
MKKSIAERQRPELVGGGLIRFMGGWSVVKSLRRSGTCEKGDARILGSGDFVSRMIDEAGHHVRRQLSDDAMLERAG